MTKLNVALLKLPASVKQKLIELSSSIEFDKACDKGANGYTIFGKNRVSNQKVAIKFYYWGGDPQFHAEPRNLAAIRSDYVIEILDAAFVDNEYAYFLTPYYPGGDLDDLVAKAGIRGNRHAVQLTQNILSGLVELHALRLLHRDLKPQNILIGQRGRAIIGDFGSVKALPEGMQTVLGSGHSLIYRPPESITNDEYGFPGDIYQVGVVLFQLLGGQLPYDELSWLNKREKKKYSELEDAIERSIFATHAISAKIERGKIVDTTTLPPWVGTALRRTISKACNRLPKQRFESTAAFLAHLAGVAPSVLDWQLLDGQPTFLDKTSYRVCIDAQGAVVRVEKRARATWRRDNTIVETDIGAVVREIESRVTS